MKPRSLVALLGAAALSLSLAACGSGSTNTDAAAAGGSNSVCPDGTLTFGVEPYDDAAKLIPAYRAVGADLGKKLGCKVDVQISESYVAEILAMKNGKLDLGEFGPAGFVFASQQAKAVPLASFADKNGKLSTYTAGIWVKKGSPITSLAQLKGHTLALGETGSTSGDWEPRYALVKAGIDKDVKTQYAGGHPEALQALVHGKVDAAEINSQTETSAQAACTFDPSDYTEIWKSGPIANDPIAAAPSLPADARKKIQQALLSLSASDFTTGGASSIATELAFTPPSSGKVMLPVTTDTYRQLFDLAKSLGLSAKDL